MRLVVSWDGRNNNLHKGNLKKGTEEKREEGMGIGIGRKEKNNEVQKQDWTGTGRGGDTLFGGEGHSHLPRS